MKLRGAAITTVAIVAIACVWMLTPSPVYAFREPFADQNATNCSCHLEINRLGGNGANYTQEWIDANCAKCHTFGPDTGDANTAQEFPFSGPFQLRGPHGVYNAGTNRCWMCHTLHDAPSGFKLLPGETVKATCFTCHDGSGGGGVYGTIVARGGTVGSGHSVETTNVVPGGNGATGGDSTVAFTGPGGTMSCDDCHSPHDSNTVAPFQGERVRVRSTETGAPSGGTHLLKQKPTGATTAAPVYGSDWCLGCHKGRNSGAAVHNHPVESLETRADAFSYARVPVYTAGWDAYGSGLPGHALWFQWGQVGGVGQGSASHGPAGPDQTTPWLMGYPRNALQAGHSPICQQCHEDSRNAGDLGDDGTVWMVADVTGIEADGFASQTVPPNPLFQNFPHETQNTNMLVETGDDLCLNCHPAAMLP